ncbi:MAG: membrane protein insertion efficiency factor YidD [Planctomycetes bacterium]|nr:membrane protein insertion efficiency factor YidD [Planctomycetota bacterium]
MIWLREVVKFLVLLPVRFYQIVLGPMLPKVCRYYPSCSDYFVQAVEKHGAVRGGLKGVWRVCRCHPWSPGGFDPP